MNQKFNSPHKNFHIVRQMLNSTQNIFKPRQKFNSRHNYCDTVGQNFFSPHKILGSVRKKCKSPQKVFDTVRQNFISPHKIFQTVRQNFNSPHKTFDTERKFQFTTQNFRHCETKF